jgi:SAM-dependent methyltransferase
MDTVLRKRVAEHGKYVRAYRHDNYRMKKERKADAVNDLSVLPVRGSYLDVSCGRGEMLDAAAQLGFEVVRGTELVSSLIDGERVVFAEAHSLPFPDKSFEVVSLFDVIEHLIVGDDQIVCQEMRRVASRHILITANNRPSFNKDGDDLHINKRPYPVWHALFRTWFSGASVIWIKGNRNYVSEAWRIDL